MEKMKKQRKPATMRRRTCLKREQITAATGPTTVYNIRAIANLWRKDE